MWTSVVMEQMERFSRWNMVTFKVHMELMESEVRECRGYGTDWIIGTGERETIDQGLDGMERKDLNEGITTMSMEFMKLLEPTQLMEALIYIHGADLSDSIDGAYENNRICVFIHVMEFQKRNNQWHWCYSLNW